MTWRLQVALALLLVGLSCGRLAAAEQSVSPSEQFIIYGDDSVSRASISILAEQTKRNLLQLLRRHDDWKTPIVINLQVAQANVPEIPPATLWFSQTGFGLKIQLDLTLAPSWERDFAQCQLLRSILLEMIYRNQPDLAAGSNYVDPPDWLLDGLIASAPGRDRQSLVDALAALDKPVSLAELLRQRPDQLDSAARELYRACSFALVQLLVDHENGRTLGRYVDNLSHASNDPLADLQRYFPDLAGPSGLRIWTSQIAHVKTEDEYQLLTFAETDRKLDQLLKPFLDETKAGDHLSLVELARRKISPAERARLMRLKLDLLLLAARANPILRPTIQDYQQIAAALAAGKNRGVVARIGRIGDLRAKIAARMSAIDDYLNWFEAVKLKTDSGLFADYLSAVKEQQDNHEHRRDPLSIYLDALEEQF